MSCIVANDERENYHPRFVNTRRPIDLKQEHSNNEGVHSMATHHDAPIFCQLSLMPYHLALRASSSARLGHHAPAAGPWLHTHRTRPVALASRTHHTAALPYSL